MESLRQQFDAILADLVNGVSSITGALDKRNFDFWAWCDLLAQDTEKAEAYRLARVSQITRYIARLDEINRKLANPAELTFEKPTAHGPMRLVDTGMIRCLEAEAANIKWLLTRLRPHEYGDRLQAPQGDTSVPYPVAAMPELDPPPALPASPTQLATLQQLREQVAAHIQKQKTPP